MKKRYVAVLVATFMTVSASMTAFAATAQDIINMNPTSYTAGTNSVYGVSSTQDQLNAVAQAVADFKTNYINDSMDNDTKIRTAYDYLVNKVSYIDWNQGEGANAAYGALVRGQAACSGYARAFKALCDAMGVSCYYIHSTGNDHQWNMVEFNDGYYFVDVQANDSSGFDWIYHSSTHPYAYDTTQFPAIGSKSGQNTSGSTAVAEGWVQDATGWWYRDADGSYPANAWKLINGKWYYFEESGYMAANKWINGTYYVGSDGAMLTNTTTPDGYKVDENGAWIQEAGQITQQANGMRVWMDGANIGIGSHQEGMELYNRETRLGVENVVILNPNANTIEFRRELGGNIEPSGHKVYIAGFAESRGTLYAIGQNGEPVSYDFEYNKPYNLDFTGTHPTAQSLADYCKANNILIRVWVEDETQTDATITWQGQYYSYPNENSTLNGRIGQ